MTRRTAAASGRPLPGEYAPHAQADIEAVVGTDATTVRCVGTSRGGSIERHGER
jgi:hypothetical protein